MNIDLCLWQCCTRCLYRPGQADVSHTFGVGGIIGNILNSWLNGTIELEVLIGRRLSGRTGQCVWLVAMAIRETVRVR